MLAGRYTIDNGNATFTRQNDGEEFDFWSVTAEVEIEEPVSGVVVQEREFSGTIEFPHPIPKDVFFKENGHPFAFDVEVEGHNERLDIDSLLVANPRGDTIEFVAENADYTKFNPDGNDDDGGQQVTLELDGESIEIDDMDVDFSIDPSRGKSGTVLAEAELNSVAFSGTFTATWEAADG